MDLDIILSIILSPLATLLAAWLRARRASRGNPSSTNQVAYEMAYRGMLHSLAGQRIKSREQSRDGKAWLRQAAYTHRRSSHIGRNDAIDDIKEAVVASAITIGSDMRWDADFLERQIRARLESRMGCRPASQFRQTWSDAIQSAAFYQEAMRSQMRWQQMISNVAQFVGALALFAAAVFLITSAPGAWSALDRLPPDILAPERLLQLKILYSVVTAGFLGGGIGLLFAGR